MNPLAAKSICDIIDALAAGEDLTTCLAAFKQFHGDEAFADPSVQTKLLDLQKGKPLESAVSAVSDVQLIADLQKENVALKAELQQVQSALNTPPQQQDQKQPKQPK